MEGQTNLISEIMKDDIEAEYILFLLKGLLTHLKKVEERIFFFSEIFNTRDLNKLKEALGTLNHFLTFVLKGATIRKGEGTHV